MAVTAADIDELKAALATAKKKTMNFAICLGKTAETTVFLIHKSRAPEVLARQAKTAGETVKIASGQIDVVGSKIELRCLDDIPSGIAKRTRTYLAGHKLSYKVYVLDAEGNTVEGGENDEQSTGDGAGPDGNPPSSQDADWARIAALVAPKVEAFVASGAEKAKAVDAAWKGALAAAANGRIDDARAVVTRIMPLLGQPAQSDSRPEAPTTPDPTATVEPAVPPPDVQEAGVADDTAKPFDPTVFSRVAGQWRDALATMQKEIAKLESAIVTRLSPDPRMAEIVADARDLPDRLDVFDVGLEAALETLAKAGDDRTRQSAQAEARALLKECAGALEMGFFKTVDDRNGFVPVAVTGTARKALAQVARVLG
jgi:hypothetical protein